MWILLGLGMVFLWKTWWLWIVGMIAVSIISSAMKSGQKQPLPFYQAPRHSYRQEVPVYRPVEAQPASQERYQSYEGGYQASAQVQREDGPIKQQSEAAQRAEQSQINYEQPQAEYPQQMPPM